MSDVTAVLVVVAGYLLGAFPTAMIVARRSGHDPTREGSGNPGASNVYRVAGRRAGLVTFAGDVAKAALAAALGRWVGGHDLGLMAGVAAIVGHTLPPWGHRGGKGVAAAAGMTFVLYPLVGLGAVVGWFAIARATNTASVASMAVALGVPAGVALVGRPSGEVLAMVAVALYLLGRHAPNIVALARGEERGLRSDPPGRA